MTDWSRNADDPKTMNPFDSNPIMKSSVQSRNDTSSRNSIGWSSYFNEKPRLVSSRFGPSGWLVSNEQAEDEAKRQVTLQKRICLVICTVLPLLTTAATLLRLWQVGVFS